MLNTRDYATPIFNSLNDSQLLDFLRLFADDNTLARIESDQIASGTVGKRYNSFKELLQDIDFELQKGIDDVNNGNIKPAKQAFADIRKDYT